MDPIPAVYACTWPRPRRHTLQARPNIPAERLYDKRDNGLKLSNPWCVAEHCLMSDDDDWFFMRTVPNISYFAIPLSLSLLCTHPKGCNVVLVPLVRQQETCCYSCSAEPSYESSRFCKDPDVSPLAPLLSVA